MKYIIRFRKTGTICYTSHLDIMKVFKRAFKRTGIRLAYSQGFNPHPKMGFAQPLSLGHEGLEEYIEFETAELNPDAGRMREVLMEPLSSIMPEGLELTGICEGSWLKKTLAAETEYAKYQARIPMGDAAFDPEELVKKYMLQDEILTYKKQKKKPEPVLVNIKPKIRHLSAAKDGENMILAMELDQGSESNLSPELVITTFLEIIDRGTERSDIDVTRSKIGFAKNIDKNFQFK